MSDDSGPDPIGDLIRSEPPKTRAEILGHLESYLAAQEAIDSRYDDDPPKAIRAFALEAVMMLHAALAPAGSPGPCRVWADLMGAILQIRRGEPPSLLRHGPPPDPNSHPSPPHVILGRALAAAAASLLIADGCGSKTAHQLVADELLRAGVTFARRNANPAGRVEYWRRTADDRNGHEPLHRAYREMHAMLSQQVTVALDRREVLLAALREGVRRFQLRKM